MGSTVGLFVFVGGVVLLLLTFRLAYDMFSTPPKVALGLPGQKAIDFGLVGNSLTGIFVRIFLLLIMGIIGSLIANRGVHLYTHSRGLPTKPESPDAV